MKGNDKNYQVSAKDGNKLKQRSKKGEKLPPRSPVSKHQENSYKGSLNGANPRTKSNSFSSFISYRWGSILFCLSALSIIYGLAEIIKPIFIENVLTEKIACIVAIHLYATLLIIVLLGLIKHHNVKDDAVSLVIIIAPFFIVSGILVSSIANDYSLLPIIIGLGGFALAWLQMSTLITPIKLNISLLQRIGIGGVIIWNYLLAIIMAAYHRTSSIFTAQGLWRYGSIILLGSLACLLWDSSLTSKRDAPKTPFINSPMMSWIFILEVFIATLIHQYVLAFIFDIPFVAGELSPFLLFLTFILINLSYNSKHRNGLHTILGILPLLAVTLTAFNNSVPTIHSILYYFWSPKLLIISATLVFLTVGIKTKNSTYFILTLLYLTTSFTLYGMSWQLLICLWSLIFIALFIIKKQATLLFFISIITPVFLVNYPPISDILYTYSIPTFHFSILLIGLFMLSIYNLFYKKLGVIIGNVAGFLVGLGAFIFLYNYHGIGLTLLLMIILITLGITTWVYTNNKVATTFTVAPLLIKISPILKVLEGWGFILLSFLLLGGGTLSCFYKEKRHLKEKKGEL